MTTGVIRYRKVPGAAGPKERAGGDVVEMVFSWQGKEPEERCSGRGLVVEGLGSVGKLWRVNTEELRLPDPVRRSAVCARFNVDGRVALSEYM